MLILGSPAMLPAAKWTLETDVQAQEIVTNNVLLGPGGQTQSDFITDVSPGLRVKGEGDRLKLNFDYRPSLLIFGRNSDQNRIRNDLNADAQTELAENFFFFDARARVEQDTTSPFGPRPSDAALTDLNLTETYALEGSPYLRGRFGPDINWEVRNTTALTFVGSSALDDTRQTQWLAHVESPVRLVGWRVDYQWDKFDVESQPPSHAELYRARVFYEPFSVLRLSASGGHEQNDYAIGDPSTAIYGAGFDWRPSPRTSMSALWEDRFFGPSYDAHISHRARRSAWNISYLRRLNTSPDELLRLPLGNTAALLDAILVPRVPDPEERQVAIEEIFRSTGLPSELSAPSVFYTEQISLVERVTCSVAIIGVRNWLAFGAYHSRSKRVSDQLVLKVGDAFAIQDAFTQQGMTVAFAHRLSPTSTITATYIHVVAKGETDNTADSSQDNYGISLTKILSPKTSVSASLQHLRFDSKGPAFSDFRASAVVVGAVHRF